MEISNVYHDMQLDVTYEQYGYQVSNTFTILHHWSSTH